METEGINYVDSTNSGVYYSIIDYGNEQIYPETNDIVSIHLAGYYTNDSIFFTNDSVDLVIFDTNIEHRGVPPTNVDRRLVLNINYFEK